MKKYIFIFIILSFCSQSENQVIQYENNIITETSFQFINTDLKQDYENFSDKKTIIIFWADY